MTRTLILTRHAKSSWDDPFQEDFDRPLNKRGQKSAKAIGTWLRDKGWQPDQVLSSSSRRTRETWKEMGFDTPEPDYTDVLYHASPQQIFDVLREASGRTVLLLGHNPGIATFARSVVEEAPAHARFFDYPTCATTTIEFPICNWHDLGKRTGEVMDFVVPRDLLE